MYLSKVIGQLGSVDDVSKLLKHCMASISSLFNFLIMMLRLLVVVMTGKQE